MDVFCNHWRYFAAAAVVVALVVRYRFVLWLFGVIIVPDDAVGMVTQKFVLFGGNRLLPDGRLVALNGVAGFQSDTLSPGLHIGLWPWQYAVDLAQFLTMPQGKVGTVEACDGKPLVRGRLVAREVDCGSFQDARTFLTNGGERGPQMTASS